MVVISFAFKIKKNRHPKLNRLLKPFCFVDVGKNKLDIIYILTENKVTNNHIFL